MTCEVTERDKALRVVRVHRHDIVIIIVVVKARGFKVVGRAKATVLRDPDRVLTDARCPTVLDLVAVAAAQGTRL